MLDNQIFTFFYWIIYILTFLRVEESKRKLVIRQILWYTQYI